MATARNFCLLGNCFKNVKYNRNVCIASKKSISTTPTSSAATNDTETHTGQKWDSNDYRMVRFTETPKQVNTQFAIDLIAKVPPATSTKRVVWCDGGGGPTGHPKVYINLDKPGNHSCGYCGLRFYKDGSHGH